ncbi:MAG: S8 family serine peptidase [bacterium]
MQKKFISIFLVLALSPLMVNAQLIPWVPFQVIPNEIIVHYTIGANYAQIVQLYEKLGLMEIGASPYSGARKVIVPIGINVLDVIKVLNQSPLIALAEPNLIRYANYIPNDPLYKYQWHLNNPAVQQAWDLSNGKDVIVAIFDSGIAYRTGDGYTQAPDLSGTIFYPSWDFVNEDPFPDDDYRHGTHIAGIISQSTQNNIGGAGLAFGCTLMPVKVLDSTGAGEVTDIVDAVYYAVNNGAHIINMSYGSTTSPSVAEEEAINYAVAQGVTVICSAGNEATNEPHYPSSYPATICVTASRYDQTFAESYSNYGPDVDICAPGGDLRVDLTGDGNPDGIYQQTHNGIDFNTFKYYYAEGTSCAAAYVTGVTALMMSASGRHLTPEEVRFILQNTALDLGDPGFDIWYGAGVVNIIAAVEEAITGEIATISSLGLIPFYPIQKVFLPSYGAIIYPFQKSSIDTQAPYYYSELNQSSSLLLPNNQFYNPHLALLKWLIF